MSKRLEDFINSERDSFDNLEPRPALWANIEQQLAQQQPKPVVKTFSLAFVLKVAASVVLVMGIGFAWYLNTQHFNRVNLVAINPTYAREQMRYASMVQNKRNELKTLAASNTQLYAEFSAELARMDSVYRKLNTDLVNSPDQESVLRAMIRNLQVQTEVLNQQLQIIEQFNDNKKQQQNETKNI